MDNIYTELTFNSLRREEAEKVKEAVGSLAVVRLPPGPWVDLTLSCYAINLPRVVKLARNAIRAQSGRT